MTTLKDYITVARAASAGISINETTYDLNDGEGIGYTVSPAISNCNATCEVDKPECYAKKVRTENGIVRYYIKTDANGQLFDPWGPTSEGTENKFTKHSGRNRWVFKETKVKGFEFYLMFLKTKNRAWRLNAQREYRNG